jgi:hypothetical protein
MSAPTARSAANMPQANSKPDCDGQGGLHPPRRKIMDVRRPILLQHMAIVNHPKNSVQTLG